MSIPLELKQVFDRTDDSIMQEDPPDAFEKFRADAELAGTPSGKRLRGSTPRLPRIIDKSRPGRKAKRKPHRQRRRMS
jgi:hypothetical protein